MDIPIGVDQTDHVAFFCPDCDGAMLVTKVLTEDVVVDSVLGTYDKCTWIQLHCPACKTDKGHRKFYWKTEDGVYCTERTDSYRHLPCS